MRADGRLALVSDDARCPYCRSRFIVPNSGMLVNPEDPQGMRLYQCASCRRIYRSLAHLRKEHLDTTEWVMLVLVVMLVLGCGWIWFIG